MNFKYACIITGFFVHQMYGMDPTTGHSSYVRYIPLARDIQNSDIARELVGWEQ